MRKFLMIGVLGSAVLAASPAARADNVPAMAPPPVMLTGDWSGLYAGVNIGGIWGNASVSPGLGVPFPVFTGGNLGNLLIITPAQFATLPAVSGSASSVMGGGQMGYNWQNGPFVFGVEGDIDGTGLAMKSASTLTRTTLSGTQTVTANFSANEDWIGTFRGRLGYAWDRTLVYVTGGLAIAGTSLNTSYAITDPPSSVISPMPGTAYDQHTIPGWTVGAGGEWKFSDQWGLALEYRHTDLGTHSYNIGISDNSLIGFVSATSASVHITTDQVTARLNYHF